MGLQRAGHDLATEQQQRIRFWAECRILSSLHSSLAKGKALYSLLDHSWAVSIVFYLLLTAIKLEGSFISEVLQQLSI